MAFKGDSTEDWTTTSLGEVTREVIDRAGTNGSGATVYGVDRIEGLTPSPKYASSDVSRYKRIFPEMFAYNPMRLNIGSIGYCSARHKPGMVSPDYVVFECLPEQLDSKFLYWLTKESQWSDWVRGAGVGSVRVRIYYRELARMPLRIPSLVMQRAIAAVLGALEDKIEQNRRTAAALERLARAVYENWLQRHSDDLKRQRIAELEHDRRLLIGDGYRAKRIELADAGLPFIRAGNVNGRIETRGAELLGFAGVERAGAKRSQTWDTVFTSKGTVGRIGLVTPGTPEVVYAPQVCFWRSLDHNQLSPFIVHMWMRSDDFTAQWRAVKGQTDMADFVSLGDQRAMELPMAPVDVQREVDRIVEPVFRLQANLDSESVKLAEIRDYLLPRLLSGEVRVGEAERVVKADEF